MIGAPTEKELEEVHGDNAMRWVKAQNLSTQLELEAHPDFEKNKQTALKILESKDKIAYGSQKGEWVYNFWQDEEHPRGIWRRTTSESYRQEEPDWDILLDMDLLNATENESWVYKGVERLLPDGNKVLISLSRGGGDATVCREFDVSRKSFVREGFFIPEAQTSLSWLDENRVLLGTNWGEDTVTKSGYPRQLRVLSRGEEVENAKLIAECEPDDMGVFGWVDVRSENTYIGYTIHKDFHHSENYILTEKEGIFSAIKIPVPSDAGFSGMFHGQAILVLKSDWVTPQGTYLSGSVISLGIDSIGSELLDIKKIFQLTATHSVPSVSAAKDRLYLTVLDNVKGVLLDAKFESNQWTLTKVFESKGDLSIVSGDNLAGDEIWVNYEDFLTPASLCSYTPDKGMQTLKQAPAKFNSDNLMVTQCFAKSKDGTDVPYFVVHAKDMVYDGTNPTLLYGYGGFEISMPPSYMAVKGKLWLENGGVFVLSNIRGGGEFGPKWHQAGLQENRQCVYDDFAAIAKDLITKKITSPEHLGAQGGSNGGLLMGVALTQCPELFSAIVCQVPLLDMLNYHNMLKGHSWMAEYGDPEDPAMREVLRSYSPLHNLDPDTTYPEVLFHTSTKDDRVHPGHARKMAAKMQEQGHKFYYYENTEGGHSAAADLKQRAYSEALVTCYLKSKLCQPGIKEEDIVDLGQVLSFSQKALAQAEKGVATSSKPNKNLDIGKRM